MNITGAELIIRFLESRSSGKYGAVAVIPGGDALRSLERALEDSTLQYGKESDAGILFFDLRENLSAAANTLARAKALRRPMVGIAIQMRRSLIGTDICQPAQTRRMLDALSKSWFHVGAAMELLELLPEVFRLAQHTRRGPVLLEIPEDVLTERIQGAWIPQVRPPARAIRITPASMSCH